MADFDFLDGFDADGDWGFTSVKQNQRQKVRQSQKLQKKLLRQQQTM